eukprot:gene1331-32688_t
MEVYSAMQKGYVDSVDEEEDMGALHATTVQVRLSSDRLSWELELLPSAVLHNHTPVQLQAMMLTLQGAPREIKQAIASRSEIALYTCGSAFLRAILIQPRGYHWSDFITVQDSIAQGRAPNMGGGGMGPARVGDEDEEVETAADSEEAVKSKGSVLISSSKVVVRSASPGGANVVLDFKARRVISTGQVVVRSASPGGANVVLDLKARRVISTGQVSGVRVWVRLGEAVKSKGSVLIPLAKVVVRSASPGGANVVLDFKARRVISTGQVVVCSASPGGANVVLDFKARRVISTGQAPPRNATPHPRPRKDHPHATPRQASHATATPTTRHATPPKPRQEQAQPRQATPLHATPHGHATPRHATRATHATPRPRPRNRTPRHPRAHVVMTVRSRLWVYNCTGMPLSIQQAYANQAPLDIAPIGGMPPPPSLYWIPASVAPDGSHVNPGCLLGPRTSHLAAAQAIVEDCLPGGGAAPTPSQDPRSRRVSAASSAGLSSFAASRSQAQGRSHTSALAPSQHQHQQASGSHHWPPMSGGQARVISGYRGGGFDQDVSPLGLGQLAPTSEEAGSSRGLGSAPPFKEGLVRDPSSSSLGRSFFRAADTLHLPTSRTSRTSLYSWNPSLQTVGSLGTTGGGSSSSPLMPSMCGDQFLPHSGTPLHLSLAPQGANSSTLPAALEDTHTHSPHPNRRPTSSSAKGSGNVDVWSALLPLSIENYNATAVVSIPCPVPQGDASAAGVSAGLGHTGLGGTGGKGSSYQVVVRLVRVENCPGCWALHVMPRFLLMNALQVPLQLQQPGAGLVRTFQQPGERWGPLDSGARRPIHWPDSSLPLRLNIRVYEPGWAWSGGISLGDATPGDLFVKANILGWLVPGWCLVPRQISSAGWCLAGAWCLAGGKRLGKFALDELGQRCDLAMARSPDGAVQQAKHITAVVVADGPTRVLKIVDLDVHPTFSLTLKPRPKGLMRKLTTFFTPDTAVSNLGPDLQALHTPLLSSSSCQIMEVVVCLKGVGLSLVSETEELGYFLMQDLRATVGLTPVQMSVNASIQQVQVDNCLASASFPVVICSPVSRSMFNIAVMVYPGGSFGQLPLNRMGAGDITPPAVGWAPTVVGDAEQGSHASSYEEAALKLQKLQEAVDASSCQEAALKLQKLQEAEDAVAMAPTLYPVKDPRLPEAVTVQCCVWRSRRGGVLCVQHMSVEAAPLAVCVEEAYLHRIAAFAMSSLATASGKGTKAGKSRRHGKASGVMEGRGRRSQVASHEPNTSLISGAVPLEHVLLRPKVYIERMVFSAIRLAVSFAPSTAGPLEAAQWLKGEGGMHAQASHFKAAQTVKGRASSGVLRTLLSLAHVESAWVQLRGLELRHPLMGHDALAQLTLRALGSSFAAWSCVTPKWAMMPWLK